MIYYWSIDDVQMIWWYLSSYGNDGNDGTVVMVIMVVSKTLIVSISGARYNSRDLEKRGGGSWSSQRGESQVSAHVIVSNVKSIFDIINSMGVQVEGERLVSTLLINNAVEVGSKIKAIPLE